MKTRLLILLAACLCALTLPAAANDWPQWQGPDRTDVSKETGLLKSWPKDGPTQAWTNADLGIGYSAVAVVGDRIYTMGARDKKEYVLALDAKTGQQVWATEFAASQPRDHGDGPRGTPTVDGNLLFALGDNGDLVCLDSEKGEKKWQVSLTSKEIGGGVPGWGYSESPLVDGDKVIVTPGGRHGTLAAFDKKNGSIIWQSKDWTDGAQYSSAVVATIGGVRQYVQLTGDSVAGVAADDGRLLWKYKRKGSTAIIPTPVVNDNFVYVTSGYGVGCNCIKINASGKDFQVEEVYANKNMVNQHGGVLLLDGKLYGYSDGGGWVCQDFQKGDVVWADKKLGKGSLTCADGRLYCYSEDNGTVALAEASPAGWKETGRFTIPGKRPHAGWVWPHPVVANGRLYLRDQNQLFCYDVSAR
jgi:outer membrane protein assembly factor BamB